MPEDSRTLRLLVGPCGPGADDIQVTCDPGARCSGHIRKLRIQCAGINGSHSIVATLLDVVLVQGCHG